MAGRWRIPTWAKRLLDLVAECADIATMEKNPKLEGRFMSIFLAPKNSKINKKTGRSYYHAQAENP